MTHDEMVLRVARIVYEAMHDKDEMEAVGTIQRILGIVKEREEELASNPDAWMWAPGEPDCECCRGKGYVSDFDGDKSRCVCVSDREKAQTKKQRLAAERLNEARKLLLGLLEDFHPAALSGIQQAAKRWETEEPL